MKTMKKSRFVKVLALMLVLTMLAGFAGVLNDFAVEGGADETDLVAVVRGGDTDGAAHHACADDGDDAHGMFLRSGADRAGCLRIQCKPSG